MGIEPTPETLAESFDVKTEEVLETQKHLSVGELRLDSKTGDDNNTNWLDMLTTQTDIEQDIISKDLREKLADLITGFRKTLSQREIIILDERIYCEEPTSLQMIGDKINVSRERVRQLQQNINRDLLKFIRTEERGRTKQITAQAKKNEQCILDNVTKQEIETSTKEGSIIRQTGLLFYGFAKDKDYQQYTPQEIADLTGKQRNNIYQCLKILRDKIIKQRINASCLSPGHVDKHSETELSATKKSAKELEIYF
jgi:predicted DNA-binding protein YlxM (UPF0122 family)